MADQVYTKLFIEDNEPDNLTTGKYKSASKLIPRVPNRQVKGTTLVDSEGQSWLIPTDIANAYAARFVYDVDQAELDTAWLDGRCDKFECGFWLDAECTPAVREPEAESLFGVDGPGYYVHFFNPHRTYPVYGYMGDRGYTRSMPPKVTDTTRKWDWHNTQWLCRCSQCGRELPPNYFWYNGNGVINSVCKGCEDLNRTVNDIYSKDRHYWKEEDWKLILRAAEMYIAWWHHGLCPRGAWAMDLLGSEQVSARLEAAKTYKHRGERTVTVIQRRRDRAEKYLRTLKGQLQYHAEQKADNTDRTDRVQEILAEAKEILRHEEETERE